MMDLHPVIHEIENPYSQWWWSGWRVGVLVGVGLCTGIAIVASWLGKVWV